MEDVLQMRYKELFFFKKCLKETGQHLLAKAVVVRLDDDTEVDFDYV